MAVVVDDMMPNVAFSRALQRIGCSSRSCRGLQVILPSGEHQHGGVALEGLGKHLRAFNNAHGFADRYSDALPCGAELAHLRPPIVMCGDRYHLKQLPPSGR